MFCKLYTRSFWQVYGIIAKWPSVNLYLRLPRKPNGNVAMQLFAIFIQVCVGKYMATCLDAEYYIYWLPGKVFAFFMQGCLKSIPQHRKVIFWQSLCKIPQNHKAILPWKCFASFMQGHFGECMATPKSGLLAKFIEGAPKTKWQCYYAAFWQSLCKSALACTGNLFRYQGLHLLVDRKGFCVLYARSFAKLFFRAILPGKCFVSFIQGHFGEYWQH